uniref:Uncharacterized protein n=1 Tax=Trichobilharzia regenti TaxID=157069 RepID=A0AA85IZ57_TRIRE|nr:unnamed protein product [Trichobilharzia regenti]
MNFGKEAILLICVSCLIAQYECAGSCASKPEKLKTCNKFFVTSFTAEKPNGGMTAPPPRIQNLYTLRNGSEYYYDTV